MVKVSSEFIDQQNMPEVPKNTQKSMAKDCLAQEISKIGKRKIIPGVKRAVPTQNQKLIKKKQDDSEITTHSKPKNNLSGNIQNPTNCNSEEIVNLNTQKKDARDRERVQENKDFKKTNGFPFFSEKISLESLFEEDKS